MMTTTYARRFVVVLAVLVLVGACSSSDAIERSETSIAVPETTERSSSTTPATSEHTASPSTSPATTENTQLTLPSTSEVPLANTPEEEVVQAVAFFEEQWKECLRNLPNCDQTVATDRRLDQEAFVASTTAGGWNQNDYRTSNIDALDYRVDAVVVGPAGDTATAVVCVTDPIVLTEADGTVIDGEFYSSIADWNLSLIDGVWWLEARTVRGETSTGEENNVCAT